MRQAESKDRPRDRPISRASASVEGQGTVRSPARLELPSGWATKARRCMDSPVGRRGRPGACGSRPPGRPARRARRRRSARSRRRGGRPERPRLRVVLPALDAERALPHGRQRDVGREHLGRPLLEPEADEARAGQHDGVALPGVDLAQARVHVAPQGTTSRSGRRGLERRPSGAGWRCRPAPPAAARRACRDGATPARRAGPRAGGRRRGPAHRAARPGRP